MIIDTKWASLLSNFFLDISKAYFIAGFISPQFRLNAGIFETMYILMKSATNVIIFLYISRKLLEIK